MGKKKNKGNKFNKEFEKAIKTTGLVDTLGTDKLDLSNDEILENAEAEVEAKENVIVVDKSGKDEEVNLTRKQSPKEQETEEEMFLKKVKEYDEILKSLNDKEKKVFLEEAFNRVGIPVEKGMQALEAGEFNWQKSDIFNSLAIFVIEQEVNNVLANYERDIPEWVSVVMYRNGVVQKIYKDFVKAQEISPKKDLEISDYNPADGITTYEVFRARKNISKAMNIWDSALNDVAKSTAIFMAVINDMQLNLARPIAEVMFRYKLQLIADPFTLLEFNGIDITAISPDITITATDKVDFLKQFNTLFGRGGRMYTASRGRTERVEWKPEGFTEAQQLQLSRSTAEIMVDTGTFNLINTDTEIRNTFNLELLGVPEWKPFDYNQFTEYGKITGIKNDETSFDMFVKVNSLTGDRPVEILKHYDLTKRVDTPIGKQVVSTYSRIGKVVNKNARLWRVRVNISAPTS